MFFGKILGINDLISFEGESVGDLKKAFAEAVEDYLETCADLGKTPEKTYKGTFNVRVPATLHKEAALFAAVRNITLNEFVKVALSYTLQHKEDINQSLQSQ
ncbi:type II toxin-antitoxin system HicB family antitoxin [Mucilaginibacter koreensis]